MTRTIARLQCAALQDETFQALTPSAQWTYWVILQQSRLELCGSIAYQPGIWATASKHQTRDEIEAALVELERERYVLIDRDTNELVVRSFTRHDVDTSRLSEPVAKGFWNAWGRIYSPRLQATVIGELGAELWPKLAKHAPSEASEIHDKPPTSTPSEWEQPPPSEWEQPQDDRKEHNPRSSPSEWEQPPPVESPTTCQPSTITRRQTHSRATPSEPSDLELLNDPSPTATVRDPFDEFYEAYPKKVRRTFAKTAYQQALKVADAETIRAGLDRHLPAYQAIVDAGEKQFVPKPENWLRGHCWNDDPPSVPKRPQSKADRELDDVKDLYQRTLDEENRHSQIVDVSLASLPAAPTD